MSEPRGYITEDDIAEGAGFKRPERDAYAPTPAGRAYDKALTIGWGTILRQMIRHRCGPARAADHELAWRYDEARGAHLPQAERAAMLREQSQGAPVIVWDMRKP